ncbi:Transmembrane protein adipocyte-associated 1 like protein [Eufriesea mexicana]|uniref:Transmembrane protein adipocyte-associated 1 like protein n=1 Tax=Eufriesea mexicana TaxID=516756 RepID=A0A310SVS0_9HYME|nr:PREDICTED: uncharacterized protein LOC108546938 [Eufriesea mexicana]XP_017754847.1 PREDICTED: uncharacterized protein LOC108546938 [Eufriesea mexicana]OAD62942.1 Transmembrane protein adipocyte-associated 1 like protein [Eufriesea mexicana]
MYGAVREEVSESWYDLSSTMIPNVSSPMNDEEHFCKFILYKEIKDTRVRIWDIVILVPNLLFLLFITVRFNRARLKLRATSSPIFLAFYVLVICNVVISVIRCIVSMTVNAATTVGGIADKILWVTVRFFLLSTEMSVVIFGLAFGHLDSRSSIRRVVLATSSIALAFTITQGTLELILPDDTFLIPSRNFYVFGHGGMMFWFCSSLVFTMIYLFILILPWTRLRDRLTLPTKKCFYVYAGTLAMLDLVQSIGAGFLNYTQSPVGLCVVDITTAVYLTLFTPLVYHTFLSEFFGVSQPSIMFSYKAQVDDAMDEDTVSLPHQQSFSSLRTDSDYIYQVHAPSIHMPLYGPQALKLFPSAHKTSLRSLASIKDSKSGSGHTYDSSGVSYQSTSGIKSSTRRLSAEKSIFDFKNYPLTKSDNFIDSKSLFDLRYPRNVWKSRSTSHFKYGEPSNITNLPFSPSTASSFLYKPGENDSSINLFSPTRKGSLVHERKRSDGNISSQYFEIPPLEKLQSILDNSMNSSEAKYSTPSEETLRKDSTIAQALQNIESKESSPLKRYSDTEMSEIDVEDTLSDSTDNSNVTQQLLFKTDSSTSEEMFRKRKKKDTTVKEPGGLSDYLLSLTIPSTQRDEKSTETDPSPSPSRHAKSYMQTESL